MTKLSVPRLKALALPAVAALLLAGTSREASASPGTLTLTLQEDSGTVFTFTTTGDVAAGPAGLVGQIPSLINLSTTASNTSSPGLDFSIVTQGAQGSQLSPPSLSQLLSSATSVQNNTSATHTLHLTLSVTGYTSPVGSNPVQLSSHIGGTVSSSDATNSLTYQSFIDTTNTGSISGLTSGVQNVNIKSAGSYLSDASASGLSLTPTYALSEKIDVTLGAKGVYNYAASSTLSNSGGVPEPTALLSTLLGLPALGFWYSRRAARARA